MTDKPIEHLPASAEQANPTTLDQPADVEADATTLDGRTQTIKLTQHVLGMEPYILIRAVKTDPDDEDDDGLRLKVEHNDSAELATLFVLNLPAESNPLTAAIKSVLDANAEHPEYQAIVEALHLFAEFCDIPMPESGR